MNKYAMKNQTINTAASTNDRQNEAALLALGSALTPIPASANLRARVMANAAAPRPLHLVQAEEGEFVRVLSGVYVKRLRFDAHTESGLWRLAPGAVIPAHSHAHEEECLVLSGSIQYVGRTLHTGDFLGAAMGDYQSEISSPEGAMLLIRSELRTA